MRPTVKQFEVMLHDALAARFDTMFNVIIGDASGMSAEDVEKIIVNGLKLSAYVIDLFEKHRDLLVVTEAKADEKRHERIMNGEVYG